MEGKQPAPGYLPTGHRFTDCHVRDGPRAIVINADIVPDVQQELKEERGCTDSQEAKKPLKVRDDWLGRCDGHLEAPAVEWRDRPSYVQRNVVDICHEIC